MVFKDIKYATKDYVIHKVTFLSLNVAKTVAHFKKIFGSELREIEVPDADLKKRGIKWMMFPKSGMHIHVAPPPPGTHLFLNVIKEINDAERKYSIQNMPIKESHVGVLVPDITPILKRIQKLDFQYMIRQRSDGMYQLYMDIDSAHDYFEVDSKKLDLTKVNAKIETFAANSLNARKKNAVNNKSK